MIEQLRQNFKREAAAEAEREAARASRRRERLGGLVTLSPLRVIQDPNFVVIVSVWGAGLLGLCVLALSSVDIARISMVLGLGALGDGARFVYAALAALIGGLGAFALAQVLVRLFSGRPRRARLAPVYEREVSPIDPYELGSDSLDAPLETTPFSDTFEDESSIDDDTIALAAASDADDAIPDALPDLAEEPENSHEDVFELDALTELDAPVPGEPSAEEETSETQALIKPSDPGLRIDAFRDILAEETRKYEERQKAAGKSVEPTTITSMTPPVPSALAKLRSVSPDELSLMQLVERFAAALHDVQTRSPNELVADRMARENAQRELALAEALKALELFTDRGFDQHGFAAAQAKPPLPDENEISETERDLRDALTKLQTLRGAA